MQRGRGWWRLVEAGHTGMMADRVTVMVFKDRKTGIWLER